MLVSERFSDGSLALAHLGHKNAFDLNTAAQNVDGVQEVILLELTVPMLILINPTAKPAKGEKMWETNEKCQKKKNSTLCSWEEPSQIKLLCVVTNLPYVALFLSVHNLFKFIIYVTQISNITLQLHSFNL